jgi:L-rhamnose mutarotase
MDVIALYTRLHPGKEREYEDFHREVPAEIAEDLIARGVHDWRIWRRGQDLFHLVIAEDYERFRQSKATNSTADGWGEVMTPFLELNNELGDANTMTAVWSLQDQLSSEATEVQLVPPGTDK